jgi:hypothetical protein
VSNLTVRTPGSASGNYDTLTNGAVEAITHGLGRGEGVASGAQAGAGVLTGGALAPLAYTRTFQTWSPALVTPTIDALDLTVTNVSAITIDPARAGLSCQAALRVTTDGPVDVTLAGCGASRHFG